MMDVSDLSFSIVPKSDQLNADQLVAGPLDITVTEVRISSAAEQPVIVHFEGDGGRPYKPCKTMRKVLILAWGPDGTRWRGKSMTLYHDPGVLFGGQAVGGIRISHLSDIPADIRVSLAATKGKKALHTIGRMQSRAANLEPLREAWRLLSSEALTAKVAELKGGNPAMQALVREVAKARGMKWDRDAGQFVCQVTGGRVAGVDEVEQEGDPT
jgi:hypothetical protein